MDGTPLIVSGHRSDAMRDLITALEGRGWSPIISHELGHTEPTGGDTAGAPGLLSFEGEPNPGTVETLLGATQREWIGLIPPDRSQFELLDRQTIAECLFAHHMMPADVDALDVLLRHAKMMGDLRRSAQASASAEHRAQNVSSTYEMVGTTLAMMRLFDAIRKSGSVDAPVLIRGESGTGKELTAYGVHERSARADGPFVPVNCGALPGELIQSELFGHEKGAFTGAVSRHEGRIEAASGGTLFLDEIGDLPLSLQANLLRFLQSGVIQRVGSTHEIQVDVRVVAATRVDLEEAVTEGNFREDLYHRLNVLQIDIPPLRERPDDIEVLAGFFFERFSPERAAGLTGISRSALHVMRNYEWPGNVREMINRIRRGMVMAEGRLLTPTDLGLERRGERRCVQTLEEARQRAEEEIIQCALIRNRNSISRSAKDLGVSRMTLYRLIEKYGLRDAAATTGTG